VWGGGGGKEAARGSCVEKKVVQLQGIRQLESVREQINESRPVIGGRQLASVRKQTNDSRSVRV